MAYATLEVLAGRVRQVLERSLEGRPALLARHLRQLLRLLVTAECAGPLHALAESGEARGLQTHLNRLIRYVQTESRLPEAMCVRYLYKASESVAVRHHGIGRREWQYVHRLARELDWDPLLHVPLIPYEQYLWHDELEEELIDVEVILDGQALEGMLLCALEGYLSPKRPRRKGYEVCGICLGMTRDVPRRRRRNGVTVTRYVSVMRSHPQLSADGCSSFVELNERSLGALLDASGALYPQYQAVGDFHSHLYGDLKQMVQAGGWQFSGADDEANVRLARQLAESGHRICVAFVIGVARSGQRVARSHFRGLKNTMQMSLGSCRAVLGAYRSLGSGRLTTTNIRLRLSGVAG